MEIGCSKKTKTVEKTRKQNTTSWVGKKFRFLVQTVYVNLRKITFYYLILRKFTSNYPAGKHFLRDFTLNYTILLKFIKNFHILRKQFSTVYIKD